MKHTLVRRARKIARLAHAGQFRRDGITPYIKHPEAVARRLRKESGEVIATAWLHDVIEDTGLEADDLRRSGIPEPVVQSVLLLTRNRAVDDCDYLNRIKESPTARKVKRADMLCNLADDPSDEQIVKYARGLLFLTDL